MRRRSRSNSPPAPNRTGSPPRPGLSPAKVGSPADERYSLLIDVGQVVVRAAEPAGVARGLTTLIQLVAATPAANPEEIDVPAGADR